MGVTRARPGADRAVSQQITFLDTRDLARTADFYERILGLRLARDQGTCGIYHVSGEAYLGFCQRPDAPTEPRGLVVTLVTDQVDEWCAHLRSQGVEFVKEPAVIEIQRFWEPLV